MKKLGFTLAEALITLGIIGIVSAITIPSVIRHYQKQRTVSQLKKVYTVLNQAFKMSEIDNGTFENWDTLTNNNRVEYTNKYLKPYLKVLKVCNNYTECGYSKSQPWVRPISKTPIGHAIKTNSLILADGTYLEVFSGEYHIMVDLNGAFNPNQLGRDVFIFVINKKGITPYKEDYSNNKFSNYCSKNSTKNDNGQYCGAKIISDGWKIKDDYPW
ncbi:type II secretion system protein [bacterium]|nr:type II secretion system protein [bacterium]